ncbi:LytR C-terminal domain-containing protein [Agromyces aerolatus]|uniref:LytR C-terminal domain-containing protein n=1 Tax=Agromyces sp. LY-1074 TaxID=3074080 RepID=UPI002862C1D1|nr:MULTISPECIES: LytR C-terminal domain-containing protein [unclassified Agromyces]MDR5699705.1 LytR C-terminal domain-containing protein [Agromyces sp. LY-1074]MDR5706001.1 LytR C-terminal domain-containing protein [Agromyces sp. LY-1358]
MAQKFPRDRFDRIPDGIERVGAHRAPRRRGQGWITFAWAALATVVLATAGIIGIMVFNDRLDFGDAPQPTATAAPAETVPATIAPDVPVTVLNGTQTSGLAARAAEALGAAGVPVGTTANASEDDLTVTYVYYASEDLEGAARGVAQALPEAEVRFDAKFAETGTPLVVVLGSDYADATGG